MCGFTFFRPAKRGLGLILLIAASFGYADTWTVGSSEPIGGNCSPDPDPTCTLDAALSWAAPGDTIVFASAMTIQPTSGFTITKDVVIDASPYSVILDGSLNGDNSIVTVNSGSTVTLRRLTLQNGGSTSTTTRGIAVTSSGTLTLDHCLVTGNTSTQEAIYNTGSGTLTLAYSSVRDNVSRAITNNSSSNTLTIDHTSVTGNGSSTILRSGGILTAGIVTVSHSTIANNQARDGGGIFTNNTSTTLIINHSTITGNSAINEGGGIWAAGTIYLYSNVVAGNTAGSGPDIKFTVQGTPTQLISLGYNLIGNTAGSNYGTDFMGAAGDQVDVAAGLASGLANNGGPTQTLALLSTSPAIGAGNCNATTAGLTTIPASTTDQRGYPHVLSSCTIGAFEYDDIFFANFEIL